MHCQCNLILNFSFHRTDEAERDAKFVEEKKLVDIGFPAARLSRQEETKLRIELQKQLKKNPEIEKLARHLKCKEWNAMLCDPLSMNNIKCFAVFYF